MDDAQLTERIRKKRFLIDAFLNTCAAPAGAAPDAALKHAVTSHFLQAVVLELIVKALYELDQRAEAPYTHDIPRLFSDLLGETQEKFERAYDDARERRKQQFQAIDEDVVFHPLEDVLTNNSKTVRDFKYDGMGVKSNYAADSPFYREIFALIESRLPRIDA